MAPPKIIIPTGTIDVVRETGKDPQVTTILETNFDNLAMPKTNDVNTPSRSLLQPLQPLQPLLQPPPPKEENQLEYEGASNDCLFIAK